tara:strand:- start:223 stop:549 length:327 start_codon:yes stop_codon:yes gene_type:complete
MGKKIKYIPLNRHVLLEDVELEDKGSSPVLTPDDYKIIKDFGTYRVSESAIDCSIYFQPGELVVVEENMVREVELSGEKYYIIPENLVVLRGSEVEPAHLEGSPFNED